jgi:hypothetical protein
VSKGCKRPLVLLAVALATVGVFVAGVVVLDRCLDPFDDQQLDPAAWAAAKPEGRALMARDALRHLPTGTPAARLRELLGEGDLAPRDPRGPVDMFGNRLSHPETRAYYLGSHSGLGPYALDSAFLYVHFDTEGRVILAEITGG